ncbi:MAG: VanZ family protein [Planctomycetota bacterium]|nr:VanZ family protein [Planctomycetota bacterium]
MNGSLRGLYPALLAMPRRLRVAGLAGMLAVIAVASSLSGGSNGGLPEVRAFVLNLGHQFLFGALAVVIALAVGLRLPTRPLKGFAIVVIVLGLGLLDEIHQASVPQRDSSLWDLVSDTLGAVFALTIAGWTARREGPIFEAGPLLFLIGLSAAWNCIPAFAPNLPLTALLP